MTPGMLRVLLLAWRLMVKVEVEALSCWTFSGAKAPGLEPSVSDGVARLETELDPAIVVVDGLEAEVEAEVEAEAEAEASDPEGLEPLLPDPAVSAGEEEEVPMASAMGQTVV